MEIKVIDVAQIVGAKYNPRKDLKPGDPEYEKLRKSITEFDMVEPLIINKRGNVLIGGHQRLKVLKEMGRTQVEVSVVDLPPAKEKALNLALNKISGEWDLPLLKDLLQEIDTGEFDIEITGFDSNEIEGLINQLHKPELGLTDEDEVPEPKESICKPGDLWVLGNHRLLCGDATVEADVAKLMGGGTADMVWTDPPYGVNYGAKIEKANPMGYRVRDIKNDNLPANKLQEFLTLAFSNVALHSVDGAPIYVASPPGTLLPALIASFAGSGFDYHWQLVWIKDQLVLSRADYHFRHENILYGWKSGASHYFTGDRKQDSVFEIPRPKSSEEHPTMKPIALIERMINNSSKVGQIVIDTFLGSGSTLIACEKTARCCRGMELEPKYCDVIINRWQNFTGKTAELLK